MGVLLYREVISMTIREMRKSLGNTQSEFADRYNIPFRTVQNWVYGTNTPPAYIPRMIEHILRLENELEANNNFIARIDKDLELASDLLHDKRFSEAIEIIDNI